MKIKRLLDLLVSGSGLLLGMPLFIIIGLLIKVSSRGPVFFRARRVNVGGEIFSVYKFRTMIIGAEGLGSAITSRNDPRVTRVGKILRRAKLDELPQLINVFKGEMSIVGPRPEDPRYVASYSPEQRRILSVRPGITSPASLTYRNEEEILSGPDWEKMYRTQILPAKLAIDLAYFSRSTFFSDLIVIMRTIISLFRRQPPGAHASSVHS